MTEDEAISELPLAYAVALRLRRAQQTDEAIARALGVDEMALEPLLAIAEAKLAELCRSPGGELGGISSCLNAPDASGV